MVGAKNYEAVSILVEVIQRKLLASFFPETVYILFDLELGKITC